MTASTSRSHTPTVLVVMGVSGSGKSTVAALLAERLGWPFVDGDDFHTSESIARMHGGETRACSSAGTFWSSHAQPMSGVSVLGTSARPSSGCINDQSADMR